MTAYLSTSHLRRARSSLLSRSGDLHTRVHRRRARCVRTNPAPGHRDPQPKFGLPRKLLIPDDRASSGPWADMTTATDVSITSETTGPSALRRDVVTVVASVSRRPDHRHDRRRSRSSPSSPPPDPGVYLGGQPDPRHDPPPGVVVVDVLAARAGGPVRPRLGAGKSSRRPGTGLGPDRADRRPRLEGCWSALECPMERHLPAGIIEIDPSGSSGRVSTPARRPLLFWRGSFLSLDDGRACPSSLPATRRAEPPDGPDGFEMQRCR